MDQKETYNTSKGDIYLLSWSKANHICSFPLYKAYSNRM